MYNWLTQGLFVIQWLGLLFILHISLWTILKKQIPIYSYPISYTLSILLFGLISWWLGVFHIPVWLASFPFLIALGFMYGRDEVHVSEITQEIKWDLIFLAFFTTMMIVRIKNSAIYGNERFLDMGFIASIMRNPIVPPFDPHFAGGYLDIYYYFSHWIFGTLGITSQVPSSIVYNLVLPTVLGVSAVSCYAIGHLICPKVPYIPLILLVIPRPSLIVGFFTAGSLNLTTLLLNSVHVIPETGNDYPLYNFLWGIPHPHVNALAVQLFLLFLLVLIIQRWEELEVSGRRIIMILIGCTAGTLISINSWDVFVYYPLIFGLIIAAIIWIRNEAIVENQRIKFVHHPDIMSILLLVCAGLFVAVPNLIHMHAKAITGIGIVQHPSELIPYLLVHGWYLIIFYLYILNDMKKRPLFIFIGLIPAICGYWSIALLIIPLCYLIMRSDHSLYDLFAGYGLIVFILTELFYLQESFEPLSRYNTIFKISLALWPLLWVASLGMISSYLRRTEVPAFFSLMQKKVVCSLFCLIICLVLIVAPVSFNSPVLSLDGKEYLELFQPEDARAIALLQADRTATGVVEAAGDYDYYARIASFTGVPAVIGWPTVETQWGRDKEDVEKRVKDVALVYQEPGKALEIMDRYNSSHLIIGNNELGKYGAVNIPSVGLWPVFNKNSSMLIKRLPVVT
ncbi:MAG: DUF2298 domain-containing protein [Methanospirillum sp.]|uniref:DUF2298 domain-containing protein n=1 Tax=Methanospirillum sp. TaxID=45200 RepID=UPI00236CE5E6|nr:DUF2298 domain-containing protein [Methanospirillum sp.]MDD1729709.1 DUF2298 domain-containing protein [Methanospirillum sp.]